MNPNISFQRLWVQLLAIGVLICGAFLAVHALAASADEIEISTDATLQRFRSEVSGGGDFLDKAQGVLVFPKVIKAGFVVGGEYGEGALRIGGKTVEYYSTAAGSFGFLAGAQTKSLILVFLTEKALQDFRNSDGWQVGIDGSVAVVDWSVAEDINSVNLRAPIAGFVFAGKGLMVDLSLEGTKFSKITR